VPSRLPPEKRENLLRKKRRSKESQRGSHRQPGRVVRKTLVDLLEDNEGKITLPVQPTKQIFRDCAEVLPLQACRDYTKPKRLGIYSSNELCLAQQGDFRSSVNKMIKIFGPVAVRNKRFKFYLKCIAVGGVSTNQFRSLMRIRDLWVRGHSDSFNKSINRFIFGCTSKEQRAAASQIT
jgi:hypothetical protein